MQSIFRLPWGSDHVTPKMPDNPILDFAASPVLGMSQFKRKRTASPEPVSPHTLQLNKKLRAGPADALRMPDLTKAVLLDVAMDDALPTPAEDAVQLSRLQQVIDNELNMQILLKHNELRLIEQELAKCQVALDQLRRCEVRPFPGDDMPLGSISAGDGPALSPAPGMTRPDHPSPYGVTDGPYTSHYRQWLIRDPAFDPVSLPVLTLAERNAQLAARSTRNSGARKSIAKSSFSNRAAAGIPASPDYHTPPAHKDKSAPMVLRRSTDGQLVKLICNNCQRGNFSSIQGFLNHCRIAHKVDYKSHDLAAIDCGRLLDQDEVDKLPAETQNTPIPKPTHSRATSAVSTPAKNFVHPMNVVGGSGPPPRLDARAVGPRKVSVKNSSPLKSTPLSSSPFKPSAQMPHLSAQFAKYKLGGNLDQAIAAAKQKIDFGADEPVSPDLIDPESPLESMAGSRTVGGTGQPGYSGQPGAFARPVSRKGHRETISTSRHRPSPLAPTPVASFALEHSEIPESPQDLLSHLSPQTADSNPGLVSDHEDDDHGSASEDEAPRSARMAHSFGVRRGCDADEMDLDVAVDDDMDQHGVIIRRNSMLAAEARGLRATGSTSRPMAKEGN